MKATFISEGIYRLGSNIENGDLFEGIWPIPEGVSINAYLVKDEKIALIDLIRDWDNGPAELLEQMKSADVEPKDVDYLILNHIEPDHTGWLREFVEQSPNVQIMATKRGAEIIKAFYGFEDNVQIVKTGDSVSLGPNKELAFVEAPNVHWPDTMVTYEKNSQTLFACDAFGSYGSITTSIFDDEISDEEHKFFERETLRYYANIVGSFSNFVLRALKALADFEIKVIAPSHGLIWRKNPEVIIERYRQYAAYYKGPAEKEVTIVYGSMYGNTEKLLEPIKKGLESEGVPYTVHKIPDENVSYVLASAWRSSALILGMPTYEYKMFPPMAWALDIFQRKHVYHKKVLRFGSYGWSGGAQKEFDATVEKMNWDIKDPIEWAGAADEETMNKAYEAAKALAVEIKEQAGIKVGC